MRTQQNGEKYLLWNKLVKIIVENIKWRLLRLHWLLCLPVHLCRVCAGVRSCRVQVLTRQLSDVGGEVQGVQAPPQTFRFVENPGKNGTQRLEKNTNTQCKPFLRFIPKASSWSLREKICRQMLHKKFWGNLGQKSSATPKICLLLHQWFPNWGKLPPGGNMRFFGLETGTKSTMLFCIMSDHCEIFRVY